MKRKFEYFIRPFTILILTTNYSYQKDNLPGRIINDPALIEKFHSNFYDIRKIENQKLIFENKIYRNFSPVVGPLNEKEKRLIASIWIVYAYSTLLMQKSSFSKLDVLHYNQVRTSEPETTTLEYEFFFIRKGSPEWETGIYVDVVISMIDLP